MRGEREEKVGREGERLSVACLCLMEVPGVALRLLHFTINGGSLWGKPCFSITPTQTHTDTHMHTTSSKPSGSDELCTGVLPQREQPRLRVVGLHTGVCSDPEPGVLVPESPSAAAAAAALSSTQGRMSEGGWGGWWERVWR